MASRFWTFVANLVAGQLARAEHVNAKYQEIDGALLSAANEMNRTIRFVAGSIPAENVFQVGQTAAQRANLILGFDANGGLQLRALAFSWRGDWVTGANYNANDTVRAPLTHSRSLYICLVNHASSDFAGDLAAGRWAVIVDLTPSALVPINFADLAQTLKDSILAPAGTKLVPFAELATTLKDSTLAPAGTKLVGSADLAAAITVGALTVTGDANLNTIDSIAVADFARLSQSNTITTGATAATAFIKPAADATQYSLLGRSAAGPGIVGRWDSGTTDRWLAFGIYDNAGAFSEAFRVDGISNGLTAAAAAFTAATVNGVSIRDASILNAGTLTNARVAASNVTQHQAALGSAAAGASTIARRDASGHIFLQNINSAAPDDDTTAFSSVVYGNADGYYRKASPTRARAALGLQAIAQRRVALIDFVGSTATINKSFGITSLIRNGAGDYTVDYTAAGFAAAPFIFTTTQENATTANHGAVGTTSVNINVRDNANAAADARVHVMFVEN